MSANTYAGNPANYPSDIHKVETGDPTVGGTWQVAIAELADRTAYIQEAYERNYIYTSGSTNLNLSTIAKACGVEFIVVGGGQGGGRGFGEHQGIGGHAGQVNRVYIPLKVALGHLNGPNNFEIVVGDGGAAGGLLDLGNSGFPSFVRNVGSGAPFVFAHGGGEQLSASTNYATNTTFPWYAPPTESDPWDRYGYSNMNSYLARPGGPLASYAHHYFNPGGKHGTLGPDTAGKAGFGAGAGGGGGVLTSGSVSNLSGNGGHGGYAIDTLPAYQAGNGSVTSSFATALGGRGANGIVIARVFYRPA